MHPDYENRIVDSILEVDNLTISNVTFNIKGNYAAISPSGRNIRITGLNVNKCVVNGTNKYGDSERLFYFTIPTRNLKSKEASTLTGVVKTDVDFNSGVNNVSVTNCTFNQLHQVAELRNINGLKFSDNVVNANKKHVLLITKNKPEEGYPEEEYSVTGIVQITN